MTLQKQSMNSENMEIVELNEFVSLVAKHEEGGFEFHIINGFDSTTNQIVHCFLDPQPHDSVIAPTGTPNAIIITPKSNPQHLLSFQAIIMEALISYFFDNQKTYNVKDKGLMHSFLHRYPLFDVTKNQLIVLWKQIGSIAQIKDNYEKGLIVQRDIFHDYKEDIKENESKQKGVEASIKQYNKEQLFIEDIRTNPKAGEIIKQCKQLHEIKKDIKQLEQNQQSILDKQENISKKAEDIESQIDNITTNRLLLEATQNLTPKEQKQKSELLSKKKSQATMQNRLKELQQMISKYNNQYIHNGTNISRMKVKVAKILTKLSKKHPIIGDLYMSTISIPFIIDKHEQELSVIYESIHTYTYKLQSKKDKLTTIHNDLYSVETKIKSLRNNKKRVEDSINGRNKQVQLKQNEIKNITKNYDTIKNPTMHQTNKCNKKINRLQGYVDTLHEEINSLNATKNMILENIAQTKEHLTSIKDQKTQLIVSYLSQSDQDAYDLCSKNIEILNQQVKTLNNNKVGKSKSKKREIDTTIKTLKDQIAQQEGTIYNLENSYCKTEENTLHQLVEQKNTTRKLIQSLRVQQEKAACDLNDLLQHIASINSQSIGGETLHNKLSKKKEEHDILIKSHETLVHDTKSLISSYVQTLISYEESVHDRMQSIYEYYQQGQRISHEMKDEHSRHLTTLAFKWSQSQQFIQELKDSINKSGLMFLSEGSGHSNDITIIYTTINNLLSWTNNDQSLLNQYGKELGKLHTTTKLQQWDYFDDERTGEHTIHETQKQETLKNIDQEIDRLAKESEQKQKLIQLIESNIIGIHEVGKIQVPKTNARINELKKELNIILGWEKQYKKEKQNILSEQTSYANKSQGSIPESDMIEKENTIKELENSIRTLETKKAMITHFTHLIGKKK
ncbi:MAG TPA: hypothetical protein PK048_00085 [Candidatus Absconditabacterales bacterium]|nr:hypothetical protein [Candidatus Absconditabacterales bacterium]